jgi:hypothetical protein
VCIRLISPSAGSRLCGVAMSATRRTALRGTQRRSRHIMRSCERVLLVEAMLRRGCDSCQARLGNRPDLRLVAYGSAFLSFPVGRRSSPKTAAKAHATCGHSWACRRRICLDTLRLSLVDLWVHHVLLTRVDPPSYSRLECTCTFRVDSWKERGSI